MADESLKEIAKLDLPYGRMAMVREVTFDSGLRMLRLVLREGTRITQVDLDEESARELGHLLSQNATNQDA